MASDVLARLYLELSQVVPEGTHTERELKLLADNERLTRERDEARAEAAKWREAAKVKTVRTITRPVPRFEPEESDDE